MIAFLDAEYLQRSGIREHIFLGTSASVATRRKAVHRKVNERRTFREELVGAAKPGSLKRQELPEARLGRILRVPEIQKTLCNAQIVRESRSWVCWKGIDKS